MNRLIIGTLLVLLATAAQAQIGLKEAIYALQVVAGIRHQTEIAGQVVWIKCPTEGKREQVIIPGFLPAPEGKAILIYRIDGVPRYDGKSYFIDWYSYEMGSGGKLYFTPENNYTWTGTIILQPGQTWWAMGRPIVPGPGQEFSLPNPSPFGFFATLIDAP